MTYRVLWIQSALDELAILWMNADSAKRVEINRAVLRIDKLLASDPFAQSESRDPGEWVFFTAPLGILLEIDSATQMVWVLSVWQYR